MKLNTIIANTYQTQQRLTGLFVSSGSMLAILLELLLIVAGFSIAVAGPTQSIVTIGLFTLVGLLVALLITKLTLTNAAKLRTSLDAENAKRLAYKEWSRGKALPNEVRGELDKDIEETMRGRWTIYLLIAFGVSASIVCETFVMQILFTQLQPAWIGHILSIFLAGLVSCTVVSGELHKRRDAELIKDSLSHDSFLELAAKANTYDAFNQKMMKAASTHVDHVLDQSVLSAYAQSLVYRSIEESTGTQNFREQVEAIRNQQLQIARLQEDQNQRLLIEARGQNDPNTEPVAPIKLHDESDLNPFKHPFKAGLNTLLNTPVNEPTEPIGGLKSEGIDYGGLIEDLYRKDPTITSSQVAKELGCSYPTAKKWLERFKANNAG